MRKRTRLLISTSILIGAIFFAGEVQLASAQGDGFALYQLNVHCGNSSLVTKIFTHSVTSGGTEGRPLMGTKVICAGKKCAGGPVTLAAALAGLPANVSVALQTQVDNYRQNLPAGDEWLLTCLGTDKKPPAEKSDCREKFLSPKGRSPDKGNCCDVMPETGGLFAAGTTVPVAIIYSEPSTDSRVVGNQPNGTRVVYSQTSRVNGETWYYVHPPGRPAGWIRGSELVCLRPGTPTPLYYDSRRQIPIPDGGPTERPVAATVAGGRG